MDRRLVILALGMFALGTDSFVIAGLLPELSRGFHVGIGAAGQMTTVYAVTYALLAPVIAALAAHVSRKQLMLGGLALFVVANLATAAAPTFALALATRALAGLGAAMFGPTATGAATLIVPPERRGFAISVVVAGMTVSTALGAPIGTMIGSLGNWHWTMVFVAALAAVSGFGVSVLLSHIPMPPPVSLGKRLAPLADARVGLTLGTTFLFLSAAFTIYTYLSAVFERAIGAHTAMLSVFLVLWGAAGTVSNLLVGRVVDAIGTRRVLVTMLALLIVDFALLPWTSAHLWSAIPAVVVWGACGWGLLVPQQHRIVSIAPPLAPILLGLNNSASFLGTTAAGLIGAAGLQVVSGYQLGFVAAGFALAALVVAELATRSIDAVRAKNAEGRRSLAPVAGASEQART